MITQEEVIRVIKQVYDPEIPVNIYDLGLIYDVAVDNDKVKIKMTLTTQSCPSAQELPEMVRTRVNALPAVKEVKVDVVWEPQWNPSMISPEGKKILKLEEGQHLLTRFSGRLKPMNWDKIISSLHPTPAVAGP